MVEGLLQPGFNTAAMGTSFQCVQMITEFRGFSGVSPHNRRVTNLTRSDPDAWGPMEFLLLRHYTVQEWADLAASEMIVVPIPEIVQCPAGGLIWAHKVI